MNNEFCTALASNDRPAIQRQVDRYLSTIDSSQADQEKFRQIQTWMEKHDCVDSVNSSAALLDTDPPVKQFIVQLKDAGTVTIGIVVSPGRMKFNK